MEKINQHLDRKLTIALNLKPIDGPFGGGNEFLRLFVAHLIKLGHRVKFDLSEQNIDFIFLLDPRRSHMLAAFSIAQISRYRIRNRQTLVIHRVNECDERKKTRSLNRKLRVANCLSDHTICVSKWLTNLDLFCRCGSKKSKSTNIEIIRNGSNPNIFYPDKNYSWNKSGKLRIVTHHWSSNSMKGANVYAQLDGLLNDPNFQKHYEFTYIGNVPDSIEFKNTKVIGPLYGEVLARELRKHHVYVTGSVNEPGGNHQNEAGLSGLPIIYLNSGSMREYCQNFGVEIQSELQLESALEKIRTNYDVFREKMLEYPHTANQMLSQYDYVLRGLESSRIDIANAKKLSELLKTAAKAHLCI